LQLASRFNILGLSRTATKVLLGLNILGSTFVFGLALRLSTLSSPIKVLSFLITPFPDPHLFDPTLLFLAISAIPLAAFLFQIGVWLRKSSTREVDLASRKIVLGSTEQTPLVQESSRPSSRVHLPILDHEDRWPGHSDAGVDKRLLIGAALFGIGWGIEGICRESRLALRQVTYSRL
jgi:uncharacterized protein